MTKEVTPQDLRNHLGQYYYFAKHSYPTPERDEARKKYLAAFDAMAEKAALLDELTKKYPYVDPMVDYSLTLYKKQHLNCITLAEALKAAASE